MNRNVENYDANRKTSDNGIKSHKCYQCDYAFSQAGNLRKHLKTHTGEKSNKCSQCDFASFEAGDLRRHMITHSGEKLSKCDLCDFAGHMRRHSKTHKGNMKTNETSVTLYLFRR